MSPVFIILALVTGLSALAAVSLRNLVHCALALTITFAGLAALYLQLHAQFVGFAQILVYIGAVAILLVFAILLTRGADPAGSSIFSKSWWIGGGIALAVFAVLGGVVLSSKALRPELPPVAEISVRQIGDQLMTRYVLPLEVLGLLLTAALIGAVIIAMSEKSKEPDGGTGAEGGSTPMANGNGQSHASVLRGQSLQASSAGSGALESAPLEIHSGEVST